MGLGQQDSRPCAQDLQRVTKWVQGRPTKIQKSNRPRNIKETTSRLGEKLRPNCNQEAVTGDADGEDCLKVIAEACLQLDKDKVPAMPCIPGATSCETSRACANRMESRDIGLQTRTRKEAILCTWIRSTSPKEETW